MVSGSIVSSLQGEPRATHDVDLVVDISVSDVPRLVAALQDPNLYLDERAAASAAAEGRMFNLIDTRTGDEIDFWPLAKSAFDTSRFSRRSEVRALGMRLAVSAPEDTILKKLHWARQCGGGERHIADALGVYEVQAGRLDEAYMRDWARRLGVEDLLDRVVGEAERLEE